MFLTSPGVFWISSILSWYLLWKASVLIRRDIYAYYSLGKGGTPPNIWGWWRIKRLKFFGKIPDVFDPPAPDPNLIPYRGVLVSLPKRNGTRPTVKGCAPQRQIDQKQPPRNFDKVLDILHDFRKRQPDLFRAGVSFFEGHTLALFATETQKTVGPDANPLKRQFGFEIAHPHRIDGSLHVVLHPEDVGKVIEAGWGERHPISNTYWYWLLYFNHIRAAFDFLREKPSRPPVPETMVFIYAPRDDAEREVVRKIVAAAAWWVTGEEFPELSVDDDKGDGES